MCAKSKLEVRIRNEAQARVCSKARVCSELCLNKF